MPPPPSADASPRRWLILGLVMGLCLISHFNRVSISVAGTDRIMPDYGLNPLRMGTIYSAFLFVYALCMIPGGMVIDLLGARRALMIVGFGSASFVALTGLVGWICRSGESLWLALVLVRGTMGLLSAPLHPASARAVGSWFPLRQRNLANGVVTGAAIAGVAMTYQGFGKLMGWMGWQAGFLISAAATALLTAVWAAAAADAPGPPRRGPSTTPAGAGTAGGSGDGVLAGCVRLFSNRSLVLVTLSYAAVGYFQYLFVYWMQYYFDQILHLGGARSKEYASIPQIAMAVTMPIGGWVADRWSRALGPRRGRALVAAGGMTFSAILLGLGVQATDPTWIVIWFTLALGAIGGSEAPFWATAVDLGGRFGGSAAAICNMGGNLGGVLAPVVTPWVSERWGWGWGIGLGGLCCILGALCWCGIDPKPSLGDSRASGPQ